MMYEYAVGCLILLYVMGFRVYGFLNLLLLL